MIIIVMLFLGCTTAILIILECNLWWHTQKYSVTQSFLWYNSNLNIPWLCFNVIHPKVQCNSEFSFWYSSNFNIPRLSFKMAQPNVQQNQEFFFCYNSNKFLIFLGCTLRSSTQKCSVTRVFFFLLRKIAVIDF